MKALIKKLITRIQTFLIYSRDNKSLLLQQAAEYDRLMDNMKINMPENIALHGYKVYSQNHEDGILNAIFKRITHAGSFMEIGIQDGTECNSLNLLMNGWKGVWIEGDVRQHRVIDTALGGTSFPGKLNVVRAFVDAENIATLYKNAVSFVNEKDLDFFSLDIDGNDYYVAESLLASGHRPRVICVEYNSKFPPPMRVNIRYNPTHVWDRFEYQGASLQSFTDLFSGYQYTLVCCDLAGINAFFVRNEYADEFARYSITELYQPARYYLSPIITGHPASLQFLKDLLHPKS